MDKLGIYLSVSLYFVVAALVEFAVVLSLTTYYQNKINRIASDVEEIADRSKSEAIETSIWSKISMNENETAHRISKIKPNKTSKATLLESYHTKIDKQAPIFFSFSFLMFNFIYWCI